MRANERDWKRIERQPDVVVYVPPDDSGRSVRMEYLLPSGDALVDDHDSGLAVRIEMREGVDWTAFNGIGAELDEAAAERRAANGEDFAVLRYQDTVDSEGSIATSTLRSVELYSGRQLIRQQQVTIRVEPPQHLRGTFILRPSSSRG